MSRQIFVLARQLKTSFRELQTAFYMYVNRREPFFCARENFCNIVYGFIFYVAVDCIHKLNKNNPLKYLHGILEAKRSTRVLHMRIYFPRSKNN